MKVKLDLPNYTTKIDLKNAMGIDTSDFAKANDLANLISDVTKLDIEKLKNLPTNLNNLESKIDQLDVDIVVLVPVDLSKKSDPVKSYVVKKHVNIAQTKTMEDKILDITNLSTNTTLNAKINEVIREIPGITNLATTALRNAQKMRLEKNYLILLT